jgi:hypothetical protein
MYPAFKKNID